MSDFFERIDSFNAMYQIPMPEVPTAPTLTRITEFRLMLGDEMSEASEIIVEASKVSPDNLETLVMLADWLGDIMVYCASEARRAGIPINEVLEIIMDSNASKLQADGTPLFIDGKLQKGPNYWKPEPKIRELLAARMAAGAVV